MRTGYLNRENSFGVMPVIQGGKRISVVALLKHVQNPDESDDATLQHLVKTREHSTLAEWTAALEGVDKATHTLFTMACAQGKLKCVDYLLAQNTAHQLEHVQRNGHNGLTAAIWNGHYELALLLYTRYHMRIPPKLLRNKEFAMHNEVWQDFLAANLPARDAGHVITISDDE